MFGVAASALGSLASMVIPESQIESVVKFGKNIFATLIKRRMLKKSVTEESIVELAKQKYLYILGFTGPAVLAMGCELSAAQIKSIGTNLFEVLKTNNALKEKVEKNKFISIAEYEYPNIVAME
jgi:hypothetical protein